MRAVEEGDRVISLPHAWSVIDQQLIPLHSSRVDLPDALHHVLASPVFADRDIPAFDRSAMDGYAFSPVDSQKTTVRLKVRGEIPAGISPTFVLGPGECARIFTGAAIPEGADTVVMQEDTTVEDDGLVHIREIPERGANILKQGENALEGTELISQGTLITPVHIAMCAAVGRAHLDVIPKPRIAILTTGEELLDASEAAEPHQIRDSNGPMISAQLRAAGFEAFECRRVRDNEAEIATVAGRILDSADVLLITGGVSVGKYDFVPAALERLGTVRHIHGIAMKPGKPQLFATLNENHYIFGLPGNPLSVMVGLHELVLPALRKLSGFGHDALRPMLLATVSELVRGRKGQHHLIPAWLKWTDAGPEVRIVHGHGSADLVAACAANGCVVIPPDAQIGPGGKIEFRPWGTMP